VLIRDNVPRDELAARLTGWQTHPEFIHSLHRIHSNWYVFRFTEMNFAMKVRVE